MSDTEKRTFTDDEALAFHKYPTPGKIAIAATKPMATQRDLSLAYSPGVAVPVNAIAADPDAAYDYTSKGNLVAVISNGTAILGLGDLGALASKPVMEGKAVLFKRFADVDSIDVEVATKDPDEIITVVKNIGLTYGGINLEDIRSPECFRIESELQELLDIPVFHDDQHGTAIISAAGLINACHLTGRRLEEVKVVLNGPGAAGIATLDLIKAMGVRHENVIAVDRKGVLYRGRTEDMNQWKSAHAVDTDKRTLAEAVAGADVLIGLSAKGAFTQDLIKAMAPNPIIFAMANPDPEITPEEVKAVRPDAIMATGRSDYPNQVNNVLGFPYIFRGALDAGATTVNDEMKIASGRARAALARKEPSEVVARAFGEQAGGFGPNQIIPKPFDPRLIVELAPAVAKAAMDSGVATRPIADFEAYRDQLSQFVFKSGLIMRPVFEQARSAPKRVIFSAGEDDRVLRAVQIILDEGIAQPILIGRPEVVRRRAERLGLRFLPGVDVELINPSQDSRYDKYWGAYHELMERRGVTEPTARNLVRSSPTLIAALAVRLGDADAMIAGAYGRFRTHFNHVRDVIGLKEGVKNMAALSLLVMPTRSLFIADTYVNYDPDPETLAEITLLAADEVLRFGIQPKVALISHSSFGSSDHPSARKMAAAVKILHARAPSLEVDGEMHGDAALDVDVRNNVFPRSKLKEAANLVICPSLDSANIAFNLLKNGADGLHIGPMLLGTDLPAHVLTPSVTARGILNMTALSVVEAQRLAEARG